MVSIIKTFLKKVCPVSYDRFTKKMESAEHKYQRYIEKGNEELKDYLNTSMQMQKAQLECLHAETNEIKEQSKQLLGCIECLHTETNEIKEQSKRLLGCIECLHAETSEIEEQNKQLLGCIQTMQKELNISVENISKKTKESAQSAAEAVWAEIFNNSIEGSQWLRDHSFSPGRWAVGYQYLYVMYRVLNEQRPKRILELGLGQSTKMISQYVAYEDNVSHIIIENDVDWIKFFKKGWTLPPQSEIIQLDLTKDSYRDAKEVRVYKDFDQALKGLQFDFISIDAPLGADMKQYSRIDVLKILPGCLSQNFVIMIDDSQRPAEKNTIIEIERSLKGSGIDYKKGRYSGYKDCVLICAAHHAFLATM